MKTINTKYDITLLQKVLFLFLLLTGPALLAQTFTVTITVTHETCPGNGSLAFSAQNAGPTVNYKVYLSPNLTTPISDNNNPSVGGLQDGTYLVVATTVVNGNTVSAQQQVIIQDNTNPLEFSDQWSNTPSFCDDGVITVGMQSGTPISYQITAGPETAPAQASPTFTGLPAGLYTFKVTDACGSSIVTTYVLGSSAPVLQPMAGSVLPQLPDCNHITVTSNVVNLSYDASNPQTYITYPLTAIITMHPPGNGPVQTFTQTVNGAPDLAQIAQTIPLYYNQSYYYNLTIIDACGNELYLNNVPVFGVFGIAALATELECGNRALALAPSIFVPPVTINFTSTPPGFDPTINPSYPVFSGNAIFGTNDDPIVPGEYYYNAIDACGRTVTGMFEYIEPEPIVPTLSAANQDCEDNLGQIVGEILSREIEIATITVAPPEFVTLFGPLPFDASAYVTADGKILMPGLPPGSYTAVFTDECDDEYDPVSAIVPQYTANQLNPLGRPDCEVGMATVKIGAGVTAVNITVVPTGSTIPTPFNAEDYISANGNFSMDNLLPGTYTFEITTECASFTKTISLVGYAPVSNDVLMTPHCGSFDISLFHTSNGANSQFWLQRESDTAPGTWGHPGTGQSGTASPTTALPLTNNTINQTLIYPAGRYRVVKTFRAFASGDVATDKICEEVLYPFEFIDRARITGIQSLTCTGVSGDIQINAEGPSPLTYTIIDKNGDPTFTIANGNNNVFSGLESATYTVRVTDPCGNAPVYTFNLAEVPSLVNAFNAPNMITCDEDHDGSEVFDLASQTPYILNGQTDPNISITYHISYADADSGLNPLPLSYPTGPCTIYARAEYNGATTCHDISLFDIILNQAGEMQMQDTHYVCDGSEVELIADPSYVSYLWSTGAQTQSIIVNNEGDYTVTAVTSQGCISTKTVHVYTTALPVISRVTVQDWTDTNNAISVDVEASQASVQNFEYSLNGLIWQESNVFTGLEPGSYTVYVRDVYGCDWVSEKVYLLTYPKFFTPNGDGINEYWRIKFAALAEPDLMVYIYDRYGKLVTGFGANSLGWDGTFNSANLPATDYWFVVRRQNGKEYKGHFSLLR